MVGFRVWTLVGILVLFVFIPIADGSNNKHRAIHRHGHHNNHHHYHHHKHPKVRRFLIKNPSIERNTRKNNVTKIVSTIAPWRMNETSTSLLSNINYFDDVRISTLGNFSTVKSTANIHLENSTYIPKRIPTMKNSNNFSDIVENINYSTTDSINIVKNSQTIATGIIDNKTEQNVARTVVNSLVSQRNLKKTKSAIDISSKSPNASGIEEHQHFPNDLQRLFGSMEDETNLTNILIEAPVVQLVRRKRSISSDDETTGEKFRVPTLLDFGGPSVENDPEEAVERKSSKSLHIRVKRDGSESDEVPSALSSQDSNYLQDLEESFALSAQELEALKSEDSENYQRKFRQSQFDLSRSKRDAEDDNNKVYKINDISKDSNQSAPGDSDFRNDEIVSINSVDEIDHVRGSSTLNPLPSITTRGDEIIETSAATDLSSKSFESFSRNVDLEYPERTSQTLDSSTSSALSTPQTVDNETYSKNTDAVSLNSDLDISIGKDDEPITGYRVEDGENEDDANFDSSGSRKITKPETEDKNRGPEVVSTSIESSLKDDNSFLRYRLDDVYPEIVEDPSHPSPMVPLVRTKRRSDGFSGLDASDALYANEADNSRTADEPYAEDNRIIDSMLSKVDYRSADEQNRLAMSDNGAEIYSPKHEITPVRNKRAMLSKRSRKKTDGRRRGSKKRKKVHKGRAKKHHRSKMKRESEDFPESMNDESEKKFEFNDENFGDQNIVAMDQEVISPHDGRRRRKFEDEENDNFYLEPNDDAAGSDRRDLRDSGDPGNNIETDNDKEGSRCVAARSERNERTVTREKRDNTLQEMKYFQNVRETDGVQNRSEEIADKHLLSEKVAGPIQDIEHLAEELLAKVNELHAYINDGGVTGASKDSQGLSKIADRTIGNGSKGDASQKPVAVDAAKRAENCRKYPATWTRQSGASKTNDKSARNLRAQRCSKKIRRKRTSHRKWDRWTDWSSCSVTCGKGRQIRWRHCIRNCSTAETEMEEKACQLPACAPGKFLGIFG